MLNFEKAYCILALNKYFQDEACKDRIIGENEKRMPESGIFLSYIFCAPSGRASPSK